MYILFDRSQKSSKHWKQKCQTTQFWIFSATVGSPRCFWFNTQHLGKSHFKKLGATNLPDTDVIRLKREAEIHLRNSSSEHRVHIRSTVHISRHRSVPRIHAIRISDVFIREYTVTWEWKTQILYDVSLGNDVSPSTKSQLWFMVTLKVRMFWLETGIVPRFLTLDSRAQCKHYRVLQLTVNCLER